MKPLALQKWLQRLGVGPKRPVRAMLAAGRVTVDGVIVRRFAEPVTGGEAIAVDGEPVTGGPRTLVLLYKPVKHLTSLAHLAQYLPPGLPRVFPVGRLDVNTEGALLFTNDGVLARRLLHPEFKVPKRYHVKIRGHLTNDDPGLDRMRAGMTVGKATYRPAEVRALELRTRATWVEIVLREGRFRQIRKMCAACGYQIVKLRRVTIGPIGLGDLTPRRSRVLGPEEVDALDRAVGLG